MTNTELIAEARRILAAVPRMSPDNLVEALADALEQAERQRYEERRHTRAMHERIVSLERQVEGYNAELRRHSDAMAERVRQIATGCRTEGKA